MGKWIETSRELLTTTALFRLFKVGFRSEESGKEGKFDVLESKDWVNVVPFLKNGKVLLVEQFRFGVAEVTLEFPAGKVEEGQTPLEAARRELQEETGGIGTGLEPLGRCYGNPAFLNNHCFHYVAHGVELGNEQELDADEELKHREVSPEEVDRLIASGAIRHSLSVASWYFYRNGPQSL